jgi:transcriptional regulator with XRE-family HTH domain
MTTSPRAPRKRLSARDEPVAALYVEIGKRIATARRGRGWSQAVLGETLHLCRSQIANIEAGRSGITLHHLIAAAEALQVEPGHLLAGPLPALVTPIPVPDISDLRHELTKARTALDGFLAHLAQFDVARS